MKINRKATRVGIGLWALLLIPGWILAQGKAPEKAGEKKQESKKSASSPRATANQTLDHIEKGVKGAAGTVKDGANKALNNIDKAIHNTLE